MLMKIILFICFVPIPLIMFFFLLNEVKPQKNLILGITLPNEARDNASVAAISASFRRESTVALVLITLLAIPPFFLKYDSVVFTYFMVWMIAALIIPFVPYALCNRKLKVLKEENGWFGEAAGLELVDTKVAAMPKRELGIGWFIPPAAASVIPVIHTVITLRGTDEFIPMLIVYTSFAATILVFCFCYRIIYHQKAEVIDLNSSLNAALTQVRIYNWGKCWIWSAWTTGISTLLFWLFRKNAVAQLASCIVFGIVLTAIILHVEFKTRNIQQKLTAESGKSVYTDEDDKWIWGLFYYNRNDTHFLINKRIGIGTTINLAKLPGKLLAGFTAVILLGMPLIGVWMMNDEFTPVSLRVDSGQIVAGHTSDEYRIAFGDIESAELINTLPSGRRTNGTGMDTVLKGNFDLNGIGPCRLCLDPRSAPFIEIKTADRIYIFGSADRNETLAVYSAMSSAGVRILKDAAA